MTILVNKKTRVLIQGITGGAGAFHTKQMIDAGTQVVAGVTPGKGGQRFEDKVPVFDTVEDAVQKTGADAETVKKAFKIILSDGRVKSIFVNIFGGILRCDVLAEGVVGAATEMGIEVPLVVRLEGTNVEIGRDILAKSGLQIHTAKDMGEGAKLAVSLARGQGGGR